MTKEPSVSYSTDPFDSPPEIVSEEILSVDCPAIVLGRWGLGPAKRFDIRVAVREDLSIEITQADGDGPVSQYIRCSAAVTGSINRMIKAVRRERSRRITRSETADGVQSSRIKSSVPAAHPDDIRDQEWQRYEDQRRQALLRQQVEASLQIQQLRKEQHETRSFARQSVDATVTPFQNDILSQAQPRPEKKTTSVFRKDAVERMFRPTS